jgi:hypothetical protein
MWRAKVKFAEWTGSSEMWARAGKDDSPYLPALLQYATTQFGRHNDWFLGHRDFGIKVLTLIITVQSATVGAVLSAKVNIETIEPVISVLAVAAVLIGEFSIYSCRRSCIAALEHAALINKTVWAMNLFHLSLNEKMSITDIPFTNDDSFFVPRYISSIKGDDGKYFATSNLYVREALKKFKTFRIARYIIRSISLISVSIVVIFVVHPWIKSRF